MEKGRLDVRVRDDGARLVAALAGGFAVLGLLSLPGGVEAARRVDTAELGGESGRAVSVLPAAPAAVPAPVSSPSLLDLALGIPRAIFGLWKGLIGKAF